MRLFLLPLHSNYTFYIFNMKKIVSFFCFLFAAVVMSAQNIQLHYDLGRNLYDDIANRQKVTTTFEMFKPDKWGSTFLFIDLDYYNSGMGGAYWEISREFSLCNKNQFAAHVEYNGGFSNSRDNGMASRYRHALLLGPAWNWHSSDFAKTFSVQAMYKYYFKSRPNDNTFLRAYNGFQLTAVWGLTFARKLCTFSGFADWWYDPDVNGKWIFLAEPQFWFNFNALKGMNGVNLSLGTEVEVSNNFVWRSESSGAYNNKFFVIPTIAAKWTF